MAKKLYVGSLSYTTNADGLKDAFAQAGEVASSVVIMDKMTGRSKGFGFVEFANDADALKAIDLRHSKELDGRKLILNEVHPKK